jgi:hypothetical protein
MTLPHVSIVDNASVGSHSNIDFELCDTALGFHSTKKTTLNSRLRTSANTVVRMLACHSIEPHVATRNVDRWQWCSIVQHLATDWWWNHVQTPTTVKVPRKNAVHEQPPHSVPHIVVPNLSCCDCVRFVASPRPTNVVVDQLSIDIGDTLLRRTHSHRSASGNEDSNRWHRPSSNRRNERTRHRYHTIVECIEPDRQVLWICLSLWWWLEEVVRLWMVVD